MMDTAERPGDVMGPIEDIEFLTRSHNRVRILGMLQEAGSLDKHTITDRLDASRTTAKRNLDALVERGWVRNADGEYTITAPGALVSEDFLDLTESIRTARRLAPVTKWMPDATFGFDLRELADARITPSVPDDPYAPIDRYVEALSNARTVRVLLPAVARPALEGIHDHLLDGTATGELVLGPQVVRTVRSNPHCARLCEELTATGRMTVYAHDGPFPYYLGLVDDAVHIGIEDRDGMQRALVESDATAVRAWAEDAYARYRDAATTLY